MNGNGTFGLPLQNEWSRIEERSIFITLMQLNLGFLQAKEGKDL